MVTASKLAGFFAAHAIWCVSDSEMLIPMLAYTTDDDERQMTRFAAEDLESAVEHGRTALTENEMDAVDAALIYDGRITVEDEKLDAIIIEVRTFFHPIPKLSLVCPTHRLRQAIFVYTARNCLAG